MPSTPAGSGPPRRSARARRSPVSPEDKARDQRFSARDGASTPDVEAAAATSLPRPLRWAVWLLAAEAVAATTIAGYLGYQDLTGAAANLADALALTAFVVLVAIALAGLAYALARRKPRARAPAIVLQLFGVMAAVLLLTAGQVLLGVPLMLAGVLVTSLLVAPATHAALTTEAPGAGRE